MLQAALAYLPDDVQDEYERRTQSIVSLFTASAPASAVDGATATTAVATSAPAASVQADNFKKLAMPVSLVWGEKDTITPLAQAHALQTLMPSARLTVLAGVGHIPQIEDVTAFNTAITQVLQTPP